MQQSHFNIKDITKTHKTKIFSLKYKSSTLKNFLYYKFNKTFVGFKNNHLPQPYLLKTLNEVWNKEADILHKTCLNKFRTQNDVTQYVFRYWQLVSGNFEPASPLNRGEAINVCQNNLNKIKKVLDNEKIKQICLNDTPLLEGEDIIMHLIGYLEKKFPEKS